MWYYVKTLEYPINLRSKDLKMAKCLMTQYGGPDGELSSALRYFNHRYTMPLDKAKALLTDIGTEEMAHLEMIGTMIYQILSNATLPELKDAGLYEYYTDHGQSLFYQDANGMPWTSAYIQSKEDPIADLYDDLASEQKSRATYENLITLTRDPEIKRILDFIRTREIEHFQLLNQILEDVREHLCLCRRTE